MILPPKWKSEACHSGLALYFPSLHDLSSEAFSVKPNLEPGTLPGRWGKHTPFSSLTGHCFKALAWIPGPWQHLQRIRVSGERREREGFHPLHNDSRSLSSGEDFHEATSGSLSRNPPAFSPGWPLWGAVSLWVISTVPTQPPPVHLMALSQVPWGATSYFEKAGHIKAEGWQLVGTDPTNKHMLRGTCKCKHEGMGWDGTGP